MVAVIDTGVYEGPLDGFTYPFFDECDTSGAGWVCGPGAAFPVDPHGTHVAGTVAQESSLVTPGDDGLAGMAPNVSLFPIQTFDPVFLVAYFEDLAEAITLAADRGAHVINMSLGAPCGTFTWADGCSNPVVDDAIEYAVLTRDVVVVAAAGNESEEVVGYPANHPLVIAVAAGDQNSLAYYSTYGSGLSVTAPGGNILEDVDGDSLPDMVWQETFCIGCDPTVAANWGFYGYQGTSMASPHVAGLAALLRSHNPAANWQQVRYCIESTAVDKAYTDDPKVGYDFRYGYGLIDARAALDCIAAPPTTFPINAYSTTADLGIYETVAAGGSVNTVFYLAETGGGGTLNWSAYTSYSSDCSTTDTVPWMTLGTTSGTIPMYTAVSYAVTLDSTAAGGAGTYSAYICISNNDPDPGPGNNTDLIPIPVIFTVTPSSVAPTELVCNGPAVSFEDGIPGTWTVVDNEGTGVVWDVTGSGTCAGDGNYTNGSGLAACVNSDAAGVAEFDTELITNPITIPSTATSATLFFTANYQNYAGRDFFEVDVSTDGGATWTNLLSWNEDHGGFYSPPGEDVALDLSAYIGQTIQLRFRYYDPNFNDWDWYVQIDDVALECPGAPTAEPNINVSPTSLAFLLDPDQNTTQQLTIENAGNTDLSWAFGEEDQGFTPLSEPPRALQEGQRFRIAPEGLQQMNIRPQGDRRFIFTTTLVTTPVTIDGQISPGEWDDASVMDISTTTTPVWLYAKYDPASNVLYLAVDDKQDGVLTTSGLLDQIIIDFDDEAGTAPLLFDNQWTYTSCPSGETGEGTYWFGAAGLNLYDAVIGPSPTYCGLNLPSSATVAVSDAAGNVQYEVAIPLDGTTALVASPDTFFGFVIWVINGDLGTVDGMWPVSADFANPSTFGNVHLATQCVAATNVPWLTPNPVAGINPPATSTTVDVMVDSTGLAPGTYEANLCLYSNDPDWPTGDNGTGLVIVPVTLDVRGVDLELTKAVDNATPYIGETVTFTLTLSNTVTTYAANNIVVTDLLPADLTYISHNASLGTYNPGTGEWTIPVLPGGDSATLEIVAQVNATGTITNAAEVTAVDQADRDSTPGDGMGDDYAEVTLDVNAAADLELTMTSSNTRPSPEEIITVTIEVTNVPPAVTAPNVLVEAFFGNGFEYVSHSATQGTVTVTTSSVQFNWDVGDLAPGDVAVLTVQLKALSTPHDWRAWAEVVDMGIVDRDSVPGDGQGDDYDALDIQVVLPPTGFAPGRVTVLPPKPAGLQFASTDMVLEIPKLGVKSTIVGVPSTSWEMVAWLGENIGYIQSTTFPTWRGNSVLTAHNYLPTGMPGPFVNLSRLQWGDVVRIYYLGTVYEYEVRKVTRVSARELWPFEYSGTGTWITLITCTGEYNEAQRVYRDRVVVQAVLMRTYSAP